MVKELSIVVPCYNEAKNLDRLVSAFGEVIGSNSRVELILVDNGSRDETPSVMDRLSKSEANRFLKTVRVDVNQGYGYGILYGLHHGVGQFLAWTHADMQTPPADVLRAWEIIREVEVPERALVRGIRKGRPFFDHLFSVGMGWFASLALQCSLHEVNAQPKVFHRSLMEHLQNAPKDFTLDLYLLFTAQRLGYRCQEIDVVFEKRTAGVAKGGGTLYGKYRLIKRTVVQIMALRRSIRRDLRQQNLNQPIAHTGS